MKGTLRTGRKPATVKLRITSSGAPADATVTITDIMLQPGRSVSGWQPHTTELPWSAGIAVEPPPPAPTP